MVERFFYFIKYAYNHFMKKFVSLIAIVVAFYSYSSKANDNPFEFRGVMLGMTPEDIGKLESIKYKFMPDPSKLYCSDGVFKYSKFNNYEKS